MSTTIANLSNAHAAFIAGAGTHEAMQFVAHPNGPGAGTHASVQSVGAPNGPGAGTHGAMNR
jgi:hypothetical protein